MFLGRYKTYFTGKNRITLPKKFRKELGSEDRFYIILGQDGELWGFNVYEWQKEAKNVLKLSLTKAEGRMQRRNFFSNTEECLLDNQGRFIISKEFVDFAQIKDEILLLGAGDHFEIWNPVLYYKVLTGGKTV